MDRTKKNRNIEEWRRRAEKLMPPADGLVADLDRDSVLNLVHELQVHQVELELQNEELLKTQAELAASRDAYTRLYDFAPVGYVTLARRTRVVTGANLTACVLLGVTRSELVQRRFTQFVSPESQDAFYFHLKSVCTTAASVRAEIRLQRGDGSRFWADLVSESEGSTCRIAFWDITQRKEQEEQLRLQVRMLDTVGQAVMGVDPKGKVIYWNKAAEAMYGWSASEVSDKDLVHLIVPRGRRAMAAGMMEDLVRGREWSGEFLARNREGKEFWAMVHDVPLMDREGNLVAVIGICWDLTELRRTEQQIVQHRDALKEEVDERTAELAVASRYLGQEIERRRDMEAQLRELSNRLISAQENERMSIARDLHDDFGQRLNVLKMAADRLALSTKGKNRAIVDDMSSQIAELIGQVRGIAQELRPPALADLGLVKALEWYFASYTERTGIDVDFETRMGRIGLDPYVSTNVFRIAQEALNNVARHTEVDRVSVSISRSGQNLLLTVTDRGGGFRMDKKKDGSSGITSMRQRAEVIGATLVIYSAPGEGTRVTLTLPLRTRKSRRTG